MIHDSIKKKYMGKNLKGLIRKEDMWMTDQYREVAQCHWSLFPTWQTSIPRQSMEG